MVSIIYNGSNERLRSAVACVNLMFTMGSFLDALNRKKSFDLSDTSPQKIITMFHNTDIRLPVQTYYSLSPSAQAHAYEDPSEATKINVNQWTLHRPLHSLCNTLVHQCVHALNAYYPDCYFGHGDNDHKGKENTAPYWIASVAQRIVANDESITEFMKHEEPGDIPGNSQPGTKDLQEIMCNEGVFCFYDHLLIIGANKD